MIPSLGQAMTLRRTELVIADVCTSAPSSN